MTKLLTVLLLVVLLNISTAFATSELTVTSTFKSTTINFKNQTSKGIKLLIDGKKVLYSFKDINYTTKLAGGKHVITIMLANKTIASKTIDK